MIQFEKTSAILLTLSVGTASIGAGAQPASNPVPAPKAAPTTAQQAMVQPILPLSSMGVFTLDSFGPVKTSAEASATFDKALGQLKASGGGTLIVSSTAPDDWTFANNNQRTIRTPAPPAPAKNWTIGPGVTVVDTRGGTVKIYPPQISGIQFDRTLRLPPGESSQPSQNLPLLSFHNNILRGSTSYLDYLQAPVKAGADQRFYVATIRGIFPGMFLNVHTGPGYSGGVDRIYVKEIGYDKEKGMSYFVADAGIDHVKGAILHNKTHTNVMRMETNANTELQTFDFMDDQSHFSQGDAYLYDAYFNYMGNVHSSAGDENGVLYAAFTKTETNIFTGTVERNDSDRNAVIYKAAANTTTLGSGRPLINMNPRKWITGGSVVIVRPGSYWEIPTDEPGLRNPVFQGKSYPTTVNKVGLSMGGLIRASADAPWTEDIVGRYFAVDDPSEIVPEGPHRWYLITHFTANPDGTKEIRIQRFWWGAKEAGSPTLYHEDNYSSDGHVKPLKYIIAPGSNVYDISQGVTDVKGNPYEGGTSPRTLFVDPSIFSGTEMDFAPGDRIEQAIGSDPFLPTPIRAWTWDAIPAAYPSPSFDIANYGVPRPAALTVAGKNTYGQTPWNTVMTIVATVDNVVDVKGTVGGPAIHIAQPVRPAPITWMYENGTKAANLTVSKAGSFGFDGTGVSIAGGLRTSGGISGTDTIAHNLRGIQIPVPAGSTQFTVPFPRSEVDADYALFLETNWLTQRAIIEQKPEGFTVSFGSAAPRNAILHWTLIR